MGVERVTRLSDFTSIPRAIVKKAGPACSAPAGHQGPPSAAQGMGRGWEPTYPFPEEPRLPGRALHRGGAGAHLCPGPGHGAAQGPPGVRAAPQGVLTGSAEPRGRGTVAGLVLPL